MSERTEINQMLKKGIENIKEYVRGKTIDEIAKEYSLDPSEIVSLASNENPFGPPPSAIESIKKYAGKVNRYPSPEDIKNTTEAISTYTGIKESNIVLGNGSDEIIETAMKVFIDKGDEVLIPTPSFSYYEVVSRIFNAKPIKVPRDPQFDLNLGRILKKTRDRTKIIFICSPNNPTGNTVHKKELERLLKTGKIIILDEAYVEFSKASYIDLINKWDNLIVLRTFSKAFGMAGLRIGYGAMTGDLSKRFEGVSPPFSIASPALKGAAAALECREFIDKTINKIKKERERLKKEIPFKTYPSEGNFLFVDVNPLSATYICEKLMEKGVIVRDCSPMVGEDSNFIRVTVGKKEENNKLLKAMNSI